MTKSDPYKLSLRLNIDGDTPVKSKCTTGYNSVVNCTNYSSWELE